MANPQQPELARSRKTPHQDQDAVAGIVEGQRHPGADAPGGPVPVENQPGHHPPQEQDKPDLDAFAARLGVVDPADRDDGSSPDAAVVPVGDAVTAPPLGDRRSMVLAAVCVSMIFALLGLVILKRRRRK